MTNLSNGRWRRTGGRVKNPQDPARSRSLLQLLVAIYAFAGPLVAEPACAHGFAGKRFFPATVTIEDPFVADELSLPTISSRKMPASNEEPTTVETEISVELMKRITPNFGVGIEAATLHLNPQAEPNQTGFGNVGVSAKYQFYKNEAQEAIASVGVGWDIGGTGAKRVGAESFSTIVPVLLFGKGFGNVSAEYLRPLALTGLLGVEFPTESSTTTINDEGEAETERNPNVLTWGFTLQYSLPYLESFVKDIGLKKPLNGFIPLVEFAFNTPLNRGGGATTGTINPGVLWVGKSIQFGIEAIIPANDHTGNTVGVIGQLHFYLDDIFPRTLGRPIFITE
ncbi:MAG: hypothetical protein L0Z68_06075 [Gammaproteobacteria bacterium]|nr:hypothetical protein [Gammaproteobacteria bacterium]